jgi:Xaa-Pro aminopeptidase
MRQRAAVIHQLLKGRLATLMPAAMAAAGLDMWILLCQEDNLDPVFSTLIPMDTWCPILQMLVFVARPDGTVEGVNLCGTNTHDLYRHPYTGQIESEQWPLLQQLVAEHKPQRIGINIGTVAWAGGGLTYNLYQQLLAHLPAPYHERLVSAEPAATLLLSTLTEDELGMYEHVVQVAHAVIAGIYTRQVIVPGVTTVRDLEWAYWQRCADLGFTQGFKPTFRLLRSDAQRACYGAADIVVRPGDGIHCDVGLTYLRLNSDHQQVAYVLQPGEEDAPAGLKALMAAGNKLQDIFMAEFRLGLTGNELLHNILTRARREGVPNPRVYSHSVGLFVHEPGPLIGLPWEQERCEGRGDVKLSYNQCFTMELSVTAPVPEWGGQELRLGLEEDVVFTQDGCRPLDGRQTSFHLI